MRDTPVGTWIVVGTLGASSVIHFARPQAFEPLIPGWLPKRRAWVLGSGAVELACSAGLATRRPWAPAAAAATLSVIWVGNWTMAVNWQRSSRVPPSRKAVAWARLPLQVPLILWAWRSPAIPSGSGSARRLAG